MPTALIVEDEPEANKLLSMLVQLRGYRTDSAYTGGEALDLIGRQPPDIVFLDLMLPDTTGYEVCKSVKARKTTSLIPVVMVTARVAAENRLHSYCVGADNYIPKPYTPDQIFQAMADADAWRRDTQRRDASGEIRLDSEDDGESLRHLAQLRSFLVARTPLDADSVSRVNSAFKEIWHSSVAWGQTHRVDNVACLSYRFSSDLVEFTLQDASGWLQGGLYHEEGWRKWVLSARFDEIVQDDPGRRVTFVKRFR